MTTREAAAVHPVTIEGKRLVLRELADADAPAVHCWTGDHDVVAFVPLGPLDHAGAVTYVAQIVTEAQRIPRLGYTFVIERRADHLALGTVSVEVDSFEHRRAEIGYILRRDAWGQGFATEAAMLVRDFAFEQMGVHRLWAVCDPENPASAAVLCKIGMRREGVLRDDLVVRGVRRDSVLYAMVVTDRDPDPAYL